MPNSGAKRLNYNSNKINYVRTQSNTTMYFLPYWQPVSAIAAIFKPTLFKNFKNADYIKCVKC